MSRKRKTRRSVAALVEEGRLHSTYVFDGTDPAWDPADNIPVPNGPERPAAVLDNVRRLPQNRGQAGRVADPRDPSLGSAPDAAGSVTRLRRQRRQRD